MGKAIGIDLGTTNTAVSVLVDGRPRVLEDDKGYKVLPSCVAFKGDGKRVVGQAAKNLIITQPENTAYAIKRLMGRRYDSPEVAEVKKLVSYRIEQADDGLCKVMVGETWYSPIEISAMILEVAKQMAERTLGETVDEAVITVPAYFNHAQRSATFEAARLAGLRCERLLNEPTAAALAYGYRKDVERRIVVYDLGGGTFDISVLQLARGIYEVLATSGETHLGGEDFDQRIVDQLSEDFQSKTGVDPRTDATALQRLKDAAERAKCELSFTDRTTILIPMITMADSLETALSRLTLEGLVEDLIDRTLEITKDAIKAAGLRISDIDDVILVGGQTRMPRVREAIRSLFQKEPSRSVHPEEVVAIGAAVHATSLTSNDFHKPLLLDVTPFDLGIDVAGGLFKRIIQANSQVPASFTETFATVRDNQKLVRVTVRQGASPNAGENEFLGEFVMSGLTPAPRMETKVDVTFKIDTNGMLHASAMEQGSGDRKRITIRNYAEFVQGDGSVAPELEGDLGGPEEEEAAEAASATGADGPGRSSGNKPKAGFLRRLFGGRRDAEPAPGASTGAPSQPVDAPEAPDAVPEGEFPPEMPAFLQELGPADLMALEPVEEDDAGPSGLDAVGGGLDALGFDDLTPLSAADIAPVPVPVPLAPNAPAIQMPASPVAGGVEPLEADLFAMPDGDDTYEDEEFVGDGFDDDAFDEYEVSDDDYDDDYDGEFEGDAEEGVFVDLDEGASDGESASDASFGADAFDGEPIVGLPMVEEDAFVPIPDGPVDDDFGPGAPRVGFDDYVQQSDTPTEPPIDSLLIDDDFEVDDSTRSLIEPLASAPTEFMPLPMSEVEEELLWSEEELPDDGTVEFTRDGATSTPRAPSWARELLEESPTPPVSTPVMADLDDPELAPMMSTPEETLVDAVPVDFEEAPTDPPMLVGSARSNSLLRMAYTDDQRLAEDLIAGLRRGGCFVSTESPLPVGDTCILEYVSPGLSEPIVIEANVTWSTLDAANDTERHTPGMDVEFNTNRHDRRRWVGELEAFR